MTSLVAVSLMVWFSFSLQYTSTLSVMARETAHWKWPLLAFLYMGTLAYLSCLILYQMGGLLGWV